MTYYLDENKTYTKEELQNLQTLAKAEAEQLYARLAKIKLQIKDEVIDVIKSLTVKELTFADGSFDIDYYKQGGWGFDNYGEYRGHVWFSYPASSTNKYKSDITLKFNALNKIDLDYSRIDTEDEEYFLDYYDFLSRIVRSKQQFIEIVEKHIDRDLINLTINVNKDIDTISRQIRNIEYQEQQTAYQNEVKSFEEKLSAGTYFEYDKNKFKYNRYYHTIFKIEKITNKTIVVVECYTHYVNGEIIVKEYYGEHRFNKENTLDDFVKCYNKIVDIDTIKSEALQKELEYQKRMNTKYDDEEEEEDAE